MVTDQQARRLFKLVQTGKNFGIAAIKAGMGASCRRVQRSLKYLRNWRLTMNPQKIMMHLGVNIGVFKSLFQSVSGEPAR